MVFADDELDTQNFKIRILLLNKRKTGGGASIGMRKRLFQSIKAGGKGGKPGQWSARKAQMLAKRYKEKGGGYTSGGKN